MGEMARRPLDLDKAAIAAQRELPPPAQLAKGIAEFNRRQFYECHETLEEIWKAERGPVRYLYQGILQVGVAFYHLSRGNWAGAVALLQSGRRYLRPFAPVCQGVDVGRLLADTETAERRLRELGVVRMEELDDGLIPSVRWVDKAAGPEVSGH